MDVRVGLWRKLSTEELMLLNCGVGEDSWESLGLKGDPNSPFYRRSVLGVLWKGWCWIWNSNNLATSCKVLTHWKRLWCWEGLGAGGEGNNKEWDGWISITDLMDISLSELQQLVLDREAWRAAIHGLQKVGHEWATELNWSLGFLIQLDSLSVSPVLCMCYPHSDYLSDRWNFLCLGKDLL